MGFKDEKFMSAKEKELVLKSWKSFLGSNCDRFDRFTKRLYEHITLHCSFIAHYNLGGFIQHYFVDPEMTAKFLSQFDREEGNISIEYGSTWWLNGDCSDLNNAMVDEFTNQRLRIIPIINKRIFDKKKKALDLAKAEFEAVKN